MSSSNEPALPTTITSLPTELIIKIVSLSSPRPSWDNAVERLTHLQNLALVSRSFRGPAQEELFRHVILPSVHASRGFVAVLKSREGARFASTPRSLRVGEKDVTIRRDEDDLDIPYILMRCGMLESLWVRNVLALGVAALVSATAITELYCHHCVITSLGVVARAMRWPRRKVEALALTRLSVSNCLLETSFSPKTFPNIKYLNHSSRFSDPAPCPTRILNPLGGQLFALSLKDLSASDIPHLKPELFTRLHTLDLELPLADLTSFLSSLPSQIRHLRVAADSGPSTYEWTKAFLTTTFIELDHPSLQNLESLHCASDGEEPWRPFVWSRSKRGRAKLQARLEEHRPDIKLEFYDEYQGVLTRKGDLSFDAKFNPSFWAFVDDAEAADEGRLSELEDGVAGLSIRQ